MNKESATTGKITIDSSPATASGTISVSTSFGAYVGGEVSSGNAAVGKDASDEKKKIEAAVYAHLRAIRTLGRTRVDSGEIARALNIRSADVVRALNALTHKGVRVG